jgi:plastocyanin
MGLGNPAMIAPYSPFGSMGYGAAMPGYPYGPAAGGMGYGGMGYRGMGQGSAGAGGNDVGQYGTESQVGREEKTVSQVLAASGVPNKNGRLRWPRGLRVLPGRRADELRKQIDALVEMEAVQSVGGPVNASLDEELATAVSELKKLLLRDHDERFSLPTLHAYDEAEEFLGKLKHAQTLLAGGLAPPAGSAQLEAQKGPGAEVGLHDNHFDPKTLTVPAGTIVRWTNQGKHGHTVTSDKGDWTSKELGPGSSYSYTFMQPGTYTYHCQVHPEEMRGTVVVK